MSEEPREEFSTMISAIEYGDIAFLERFQDSICAESFGSLVPKKCDIQRYSRG